MCWGWGRREPGLARKLLECCSGSCRKTDKQYAVCRALSTPISRTIYVNLLAAVPVVCRHCYCSSSSSSVPAPILTSLFFFCSDAVALWACVYVCTMSVLVVSGQSRVCVFVWKLSQRTNVGTEHQKVQVSNFNTRVSCLLSHLLFLIGFLPRCHYPCRVLKSLECASIL